MYDDGGLSGCKGCSFGMGDGRMLLIMLRNGNGDIFGVVVVDIMIKQSMYLVNFLIDFQI